MSSILPQLLDCIWTVLLAVFTDEDLHTRILAATALASQGRVGQPLHFVVQVRDYFLPGMYEGYSDVLGLVFSDDGEVLVGVIL